LLAPHAKRLSAKSRETETACLLTEFASPVSVGRRSVVEMTSAMESTTAKATAVEAVETAA